MSGWRERHQDPGRGRGGSRSHAGCGSGVVGRDDEPNDRGEDGTGGDDPGLVTDGGQPKPVAPAGGARGSYTLFQLELLFAIAHVEAEGDESPYGLAIKRELERPYRYQDPVNHGRLYPNLDALVEAGFLEKGQLDDRTNEYRLTDAGRTFLEDIVEDRLYDLRRGEAPAWRASDD